MRAQSAPLGADVHIEANPRTATLAIDGTTVGASPWDGRLPKGQHTFSAEADGYQPANVLVVVGDVPARSELRLEIDPNDPRWPKPAVSKLSVQAFGGYAVATSDYAGLAGIRGSLAFRGFALELEAGYLTYETDTSLFFSSSTGRSRSYGATLGGGVRYRFGIGDRFGVIARLGAGAFFYSASALQNGIETDQGGSTGGYAKGEGGIDLRFGHWSVAANFALLVTYGASVGGFFVPQGGLEYQF